MGIESYNFLLTNSNNKYVLTEIGWDIVGNSFLTFKQIKDELLSIEHIMYDERKEKPHNECYYVFNDEECFTEFEINNGDFEGRVQEISVRFAICNHSINYEKTLLLLKILAGKLNLSVLDMRLGEVINFDNDLCMRRSKLSFREKEGEFYKLINIPEEKFIRPLRCGSEVFNYIENISKN